MEKKYKIYLDVCCLNRPFDDWTQERIRLEGETVLNIFERIRSKQWELVTSETVEAELEKMRDLEKLDSIVKLLKIATTNIVIDQMIDQRSKQLETLGFGLYDSFHIACAETAEVDVLLTTDDRLIKRAIRYQDQLRVIINNPVNWLMSIFQLEGDNNDDTN